MFSKVYSMRLTCLTLIFISIYGCIPSLKIRAKDQMIKVSIDWELVQPIKDSVFIFKDGDYFIYLVNNMKLETEEEKIDDSTIRINILSETAIFNYFIFKQNDSLGLKFDSASSKKGVSFNVDSLLKAKAFKGMNSYNDTDYSFVSKSVVGKRGEIVEKYVPSKKVENSFDSAYFYLTPDIFDTDISFSKLLEERRKMKIYKLELIWNEIPTGEKQAIIPRRVMKWELEKVPNKNTVVLKAMVQRFIKQKKAGSSHI